MLLPIGDEPNDKRRTPWMNYALIGANVVVFAMVQIAAGGRGGDGQLLTEYGYIPAEGEISRLFTCMFMHAGYLHIIGNMLFLWIFGDNVEGRLGPFGHLLSYLGLGVLATLVFGAFNADSTVPLVGASGAVSGVQGLYFVACPKHKVKLFVWFYFFITVVRVNARLLMGLWLAVQDVLPTVIAWQKKTPGGGVAHLAHIGGFVGGLLLMLLLKPFVARIGRAHAAEMGQSARYRGGRTKKTTRYDRIRRRNPYVGRHGTKPPPLPPRRPPTEDDPRP